MAVDRTSEVGDEADTPTGPGRDRLYAAAGVGCLLIVLAGVTLALLGAFAELRGVL